MSNIQDLEVLQKYLSEDEFKEVAREAALTYFKSRLGSQSPHAKSNLDFYIGQGALQAVLQYGAELNFDFHAQEIKEKTSELISEMSQYNLPTTYREIAEQQIESQREEIQDRVKQLVSDFVNGGDYPNAYKTFESEVGEKLGDLLYSLLEKEFKK